MRTFLILDKKYRFGKVTSCTIKGFVNSATFPSNLNKDKENYPSYYNCDIVEITNNCNIKIL